MNKVQNLSASLSSYKMVFAVEIRFKVILLQNVYKTTLLESRDESRFHSIAAAYQTHKIFSSIFAAEEDL